MPTNHSYQQFPLERESYERLFEKYYPALIFFANRFTKDYHQSEDIVSETFITLWEKREGFYEESAVKAFLYISTRNKCFNTLRKRQIDSNRHSQYSLVSSDKQESSISEIVRAEVLRELYALINNLPTECGKIINMRLEGMNNKEIADKLNLSIHTVKNQAARGLYLIKKKLKGRNDLLVMISALHSAADVIG